jgi:hypothetical protein
MFHVDPDEIEAAQADQFHNRWRERPANHSMHRPLLPQGIFDAVVFSHHVD